MAVTTINERFVTSGVTLGDIPPGVGGKTQAAITSLTHTALGGAADNTLADMTATYNEAVAEANLKDLASKVNEILVVLRNAGLIAT